MEFLVVEERTQVSSPSINVTFSDGYMDSIVLWKHYSNKEQRRSIEDDKDCNFLGHLLHEKDACVAMTGCVGMEDVVFTILSRHATDSSHFVWTKEGKIHTVELDPVVSIFIIPIHSSSFVTNTTNSIMDQSRNQANIIFILLRWIFTKMMIYNVQCPK